MFVKLTKSGPRSYVQLVESYRDEAGKPRQRTIATVGRLDETAGAVDSLLSGLLRATGRPAIDAAFGPAAPTPEIRFDSSLAYGDVFALDRLWHELGFNEIAGLLRSARLSFDAEALVRAMVFNRLCDATSKLGLLRWLQTTWLPGVDACEVTHQRLLRTMDALQSQADAVAALVSRLLRPLIDQRLSVVFYDLTTLRAEGLSEQAGDLRRFGLSKEGGIARQCLLSVVQTADGLPIAHRVWGGNVAETSTLATAIEEVTRNYPVQRIILVADRGLLSVDNLAMLDGLKVGDRALEYIVAVPGRRYAEFRCWPVCSRCALRQPPSSWARCRGHRPRPSSRRSSAWCGRTIRSVPPRSPQSAKCAWMSSSPGPTTPSPSSMPRTTARPARAASSRTPAPRQGCTGR